MDSKYSTENVVGKAYPHISDEDGCLLAMLLANGHVVPAVLNAAIELNLFGIIANATPPCLSVTEIVSQLPNQYPDLASRLEQYRLRTSLIVIGSLVGGLIFCHIWQGSSGMKTTLWNKLTSDCLIAALLKKH
ncbi:hypothetical protein L6164_025292 [Bauhinia variegata]|uniref:Uncharacterized protein n=1 Tax=Bauhinia variegata TaxID=167791 RepID=A0ACB9M1X1_BAUVA|nr:hypothetical protein L6164_025292 [Bauhinia variegata]